MTRHSDFAAVAEGNLFPKNFCSHRWAENVEVAKRALRLLPSLKSYVDSVGEAVLKLKPFFIMKQLCRNSFAKAKLNFLFL